MDNNVIKVEFDSNKNVSGFLSSSHKVTNPFNFGMLKSNNEDVKGGIPMEDKYLVRLLEKMDDDQKQAEIRHQKSMETLNNTITRIEDKFEKYSEKIDERFNRLEDKLEEGTKRAEDIQRQTKQWTIGILVSIVALTITYIIGIIQIVAAFKKI